MTAVYKKTCDLSGRQEKAHGHPELRAEEKAVRGKARNGKQQDLQALGVRIDHVDASQILVDPAAVV